MRPVKVLTMVLAGGIGERLYPLTAQRSKPAVPFGGNFRIIDFTLMNCVLSRLKSIHLLTQYHSSSLGHHKNMRWDFLSPELGESIEIVPPKLRTRTGFYQGTADAIYRNLDLLERHRPDVVLILSGDHIYRADYDRFIESHLGQDADITVLTGSVPTEEASSFGVVNFADDGTIVNFVEKPADPSPYARDGRCSINLGVYCFQTDFLVQQLVRDGKKCTPHDFGKNILPGSLDKGHVVSCPHEAICPDGKAYWRDVGTLDSYFQASMDLLASPAEFSLRDPRWVDESRFHEWLPTRFPGGAAGDDGTSSTNLLASGSEVGASRVERSILSKNVRVDDGCDLRECVLFPGVRTGRGVRLRRVIVDEGVRIPDGISIDSEQAARLFTTSPGGIRVVPSGYRFDEPHATLAAPATKSSTARSRSARQSSRKKGTSGSRKTPQSGTGASANPKTSRRGATDASRDTISGKA